MAEQMLREQVEEHIREIAKEAREEADAKLYREVESMLRSAYPLVAPLTQDELREKIHEAEEAGRLEGGAFHEVCGSVGRWVGGWVDRVVVWPGGS